MLLTLLTGIYLEAYLDRGTKEIGAARAEAAKWKTESQKLQRTIERLKNDK